MKTFGRWASGAGPRYCVVCTVLAAGFLFAGSVAAQDGEQAEADTVDLIFEREVFDYPALQRRNPFQSLAGDDTAGPRFENLLLFGILRSESVGGSVALFGVSRGGTQVSGQTYRLREGDRVGNSRVLEIRERAVVMEVEDFGLMETRTIQLERALPQPEPGRTDNGNGAEAEEDEGGEPSPPDDAEEEDALDVGFDWSRSRSDFIDDRGNGNGGWA